MGPLSVTQEDNFVIFGVQKLQLSCISSYTAEITKYFHIDGSVHDCCISNTNPLQTWVLGVYPLERASVSADELCKWKTFLLIFFYKGIQFSKIL